MATEEVYTNAFDGDKVAWTEIGASPYLHDTDTAYVYTSTDLSEEGDWTFPVSVGSGIINSVKLRLESRINIAFRGDATVFVWDGSAWVEAGNFGGDDPTYQWYEIDVSAILNTWAKINGCAVYIRYNKIGTGVFYVRRLTRKVDYTVAPPPKAGLHPSKVLAVILNE